ncbi:uncharacterized protein SCHCODRAFT_02519286 [Schizophyllum commune H4-8]|uniref:uncharacterized protein n=1 Tax=Schizophyllum commune (strain H4-8 / FGSC 9210) TaxID=578458 RepID=UPI0021606B7B|nr:uncharacterized protein SCHCODRAFT_02519286 [Schizophyllum commune H4-8]KAI5886167.1 hypothetical protein SCHCODRAFT_02519286 [Schizophyllum commune H4-8]
MFAHTLPHISSDIPGSMHSIPPLGKTLVRKAATGFTCAYDNTEHMNSSTIGLFSMHSSSRTSTGSVPRQRDERAQGHSRGIRGKRIERAPRRIRQYLQLLQLRPRLAHQLDRAVDVRVAALPPDGGAGDVREREEVGEELVAGERASQAGDDVDLREAVARDAGAHGGEEPPRGVHVVLGFAAPLLGGEMGQLERPRGERTQR